MPKRGKIRPFFTSGSHRCLPELLTPLSRSDSKIPSQNGQAFVSKLFPKRRFQSKHCWKDFNKDPEKHTRYSKKIREADKTQPKASAKSGQ
jgi:hypothetical protein